jgi:hypothetical protein
VSEQQVSAQDPAAQIPERHAPPALHGSPALPPPTSGRPMLAPARHTPNAAPSGTQQTNPPLGSQSREVQHAREQKRGSPEPSALGEKQKS